MTKDEYESRLGELELMHEDLELEYHLFISFLTGISAGLYWHNWIVTLLVPVLMYVVLRIFIAKKLFSKSIAAGTHEKIKNVSG